MSHLGRQTLTQQHVTKLCGAARLACTDVRGFCCGLCRFSRATWPACRSSSKRLHFCETGILCENTQRSGRYPTCQENLVMVYTYTFWTKRPAPWETAHRHIVSTAYAPRTFAASTPVTLGQYLSWIVGE